MVSLRALALCSLFAVPLAAGCEFHYNSQESHNTPHDDASGDSRGYHTDSHDKHQNDNQGGFSGPQRVLASVREIRAKDLAPPRAGRAVELTGVITESLGSWLYTFKDDTGSIPVDIRRGDWGGLNVTPETRVTLVGEVRARNHRDAPGLHIDVHSLRQAR